jgi:hypothetical protein
MTALARLDDEKRELLSRTLCAGASRDEMELFFSVCDRTGLDPFARQIYAVKRWDSRAGRDVMQTQVSIDGFRLVAQRSGEYAGQTSVAFCGTDGQWAEEMSQADNPPAAPAPQSHVVAVLPPPAAEPATMPQDAPAVANAPKPVRKPRKAPEAPAPAPAKPSPNDVSVAGPTDSYPDEYEGTFRIHRVFRRPGRAIAIEATGQHGAVWIATTVKEYADLAEESINGSLTMDVARVGRALTVMRVLRSEQPPAPEPAPVTDGSDLPF